MPDLEKIMENRSVTAEIIRFYAVLHFTGAFCYAGGISRNYESKIRIAKSFVILINGVGTVKPA